MSGQRHRPGRHFFALLCLVFCFSSVAPAHAGTSASYTLAPDAIDACGLRGTSANYVLNASAMPGGHGTSTAYTLRGGFAGQLADAIATAIDLFASPLSVHEVGTRQITAALVFDDLSTQPLAAESVSWSVQSGPIAGISPDGLATAAAVYQDTAAVVQGTYQGLTDSLTLTVLNTLPDNFGGYASDGLDDDWQVLHFNLPPNPNAAPGADPDFDGQNNLFEFTSGVVPTDAGSRFLIQAQPVAGQPGQKRIIFSPRFADRTYSVQTSTTLLPLSWQPLGSFTTGDAGVVRTVTDTSATGARKFYRVQITRP